MDKLNKSQRGKIDELHKASQRMGHTTLETFNWLLRFCNVQPDNLSEGDFQNLSAELCVFTTWGMRHQSFFASGQSVAKHGRTRAQRPNLTEVIALKNLALRSICDLYNESDVEFSFKTLAFSVTVLDGKSGSHIAPTGAAPQDAFRYYLAQLLGEHGHLIGACAGCERLFVTVRVHQHFCSPRCRSRILTRRFRKEHAELAKAMGAKSRATRHPTKPNR